MKPISYIRDTQAYGEQCRMLIIYDRVFITISKVRFRLILDITI